MRKLILFLVAMSLLSGMVFAVDQNTDVTVTDTIGINLPTPATLSFGDVAQGTVGNAASNGPITLVAIEGANKDMQITVSVSDVAPFKTGLMFGLVKADGESYAMNCIATTGVCVYDNILIVPTLDVPKGFPASTQTGVITYTVTGVPPAP